MNTEKKFGPKGRMFATVLTLAAIGTLGLSVPVVRNYWAGLPSDAQIFEMLIIFGLSVMCIPIAALFALSGRPRAGLATIASTGLLPLALLAFWVATSGTMFTVPIGEARLLRDGHTVLFAGAQAPRGFLNDESTAVPLQQTIRYVVYVADPSGHLADSQADFYITAEFAKNEATAQVIREEQGYVTSRVWQSFVYANPGGGEVPAEALQRYQVGAPIDVSQVPWLQSATYSRIDWAVPRHL